MENQKNKFILNVRDSVIFLVGFWLLLTILPLIFSGFLIKESIIASTFITWMFSLGIIISSIEDYKALTNLN